MSELKLKSGKVVTIRSVGALSQIRLIELLNAHLGSQWSGALQPAQGLNAARSFLAGSADFLTKFIPMGSNLTATELDDPGTGITPDELLEIVIGIVAENRLLEAVDEIVGKLKSLFVGEGLDEESPQESPASP